MKWSRHLWIVAASTVLLSACAEERAPINRVQPNVIRKADLEGEWYYQQTVVDMDTSANYSVIGDNAFWNLERVRWDIQENYLYARRSFEWVDNSDTTDFELEVSNGRAVGATRMMDGSPYMGAIVAAYRISSHFDIRREYNPTTGEEINVISENTTDRHWNEREYMRVDWSENLATDFDFDYFYYAGGELNIDPVPFYVQEDGPEELRPTFDYDDNDQLWYFDFVQQLTVHPDTTYYDYYGTEVPTCWFFANAGVDCATTTLTVRASFLRVNEEEEDFEPMEFTGPVTEVFGFWTVDRLRYHHREGLRDYNRRRFAQIHNIWERSHYRADDVSDIECSTDEDCPGYASSCTESGRCTHGHCQSDENCPVPGSRCDDNINYQPAVCTLPWNETHFDMDCETDADCEEYMEDSWCEERFDGSLSQCAIPDVLRYDSRTCATDDECPSGTQCLNVGQCTIPYVDREPKPIIFYATGDWPEDLDDFGMWERLENEYDWAFRRAVAAAQGQFAEYRGSCETSRDCGGFGLCVSDEDHPHFGECRVPLNVDSCDIDADNSDADCTLEGSECIVEGPQAGRCTIPTVRQMFYICHSPVRPDDPEECGPTGRVARMGDIRYNQLHYSREWNPLSPLGQSPTAPDPLTGRVFGSTVSLYDAVDAVAHRLWENSSLLNGNSDPVEFVNGEDLTHWVDRYNEEREHSRDGRNLSQDDIREMYRARSNDWMRNLRDPRSREQGAPEGHSHELMPELTTRLRNAGAFDGDRDPGIGFLESLHRTPLEWLMMNDEVLMMSNYPPGTQLTDEVLEHASITSPEYRAWREVQEQWVESHNWGRNILYADMYWFPYEELANQVEDMDYEEAFDHIRLRTWESVIVHELGHNMGLYHNFAGSEDVVNFPVRWWELRTNNFSTIPRPRTEQPVTDYETYGETEEERADGIDRPGLNDLGYSSVMDYGSNYASGEQLGRYDIAALTFGYGRAMEVYGDLSGGLGPDDLSEWWRSSGSFLRFQTGRPISYHYGEMYNLMGQDLFDPDNRIIVPIDGLNDDLMSWTDEATGQTLTRVPYLYCNDYRADLGENCHRWDFGYDVYDRMQDILTRDDIYYLRNNFRRGVISHDSEWFVSYAQSRMYSRFKLMHDYYNLIDAICHQYYDPGACEDFMTDPHRGYGAYTVAIHDGFNHLMQTIATPDVNLYDVVTRGDGSQVFGESGWITPTALELPIGDARYFTTTWYDTNYDDDCGVHFWECLHHHGYYVNKLLALMVMGEAETFFVARDTSEDIRRWRISYYDDYADEIIRLIGGLMSEDYADFAPYMAPPLEGEEVPQLFLRNYANRAEDPVERRRVPDDALPVDPYTGFTVQLYAAVLSFGMMHTNFDNRLITAGRMWICGGDHGVDPSDSGGADSDMPIIRFDDPETGMAYCAINREDGMGIAQRMLQRANRLRSRTDYCNSEDPEAPDACETGVPSDDRRVAEREMLLYRDQLDIMVNLTSQYDNWYYSYGDPFSPGDVPEDW